VHVLYKQANCRHVLARFVEKIPSNKRWWYQLPSGKALSNDDHQPLPMDAILPTRRRRRGTWALVDVEFFSIERRQLSEKLATRRTLAADLVESLEVQKIELAQLEKDRQKKRNGFRKNRKYKQCCLLATDTAETAIQDKREKKDKPIATSIQSEVLDPKGCFVSSYRGVDMEGLALQII
jgi:hypothetical protein